MIVDIREVSLKFVQGRIECDAVFACICQDASTILLAKQAGQRFSASKIQQAECWCMVVQLLAVAAVAAALRGLFVTEDTPSKVNEEFRRIRGSGCSGSLEF